VTTPTKYRNQPIVIDGIRFASRREGRRWSELRLLERAGQISDLKRQVTFPLDVNGKPVCRYVADATYRENGALVVEDAKGFRTPEYKIKARLFEAIHGFPIREV
jgi:hypothetical protein